jgi:SAM-dependent methyltransferase
LYQYPDLFDQITVALLQSKKLDLEFLEQSENTVLASVEKLFLNQSFGNLLDLGCGAGRLTIKYAEYFNQVTALEPDIERLRIARDNINSNKTKNVAYLQAPFLKAELQDEYFDVVLCNQVIQHIDTAMIEPMMQRIFRLLKSDGIMVLTTSHSTRNDDFYVKSFLDKGEVVCVDISGQEFNRLTTNSHEILPVHYFTPAGLKNYLAKFTEIEFSIFDNIYPDPMLDTVLFIGRKVDR